MGPIADTIAEVLRLVEAATKGPWTSPWGSDPPEPVDGVDQSCIGGPDGARVAGVTWFDGPNFACKEPDAALIARYRTLAPELARELQRMRLMLRSAAQWHAEESARRAARYEAFEMGAPIESADTLARERWNADASSLGIGTEAPERDELWPVYREAFEAELKRARGEGG